MGARFVSNVQLAQKSFWSHLMELLVGQVEARFGLLRDGVNLGAQ
jgi:hypothetical protein